LIVTYLYERNLKGKHMKNILAENLLRFSPKNLTESEKKNLSKLAEQQDTFTSALSKINTAIPDFLKRVRASEKQVEFVEIQGNNILQHIPGPNAAEGYLNIYRVVSVGGVPIIYMTTRVIDRQLSGRSTQSADDITSTNIQPQQVLRDAGQTVADQLNNIWNNGDSSVIQAGIQYIKNNQQVFKEAFYKVTRSPIAIKTYWQDNPRTFNDSQYTIIIASKITGNAKLVLDAVKDDLLLQHIDFKVKNPRSNGQYPELKIPTAI
jgi:hypothetical protein